MPTLEHYFRPRKRKAFNKPNGPSEVELVQKRLITNPLFGGKVNVDQSDAGSTSSIWHCLIESSWRRVLATEFKKPYFEEMEIVIEKLWREGKCFPPKHEVFTAFNLCPIENVSVVLIGQDPYHNDNQAHGLCFSVSPGVDIPPSLKNIFKELKNDIPGFEVPRHGCLIPWAKQGVLLLNASLTVEAHRANSHSSLGWQSFTDKCIDYLNKSRNSLVFLLLGNFAQKKCQNIDLEKHCVIRCAHPSPLSAHRFYGSRIFSKCNEYLRKAEKHEINWHLPKFPEEKWKSQLDRAHPSQ